MGMLEDALRVVQQAGQGLALPFSSPANAALVTKPGNTVSDIINSNPGKPLFQPPVALEVGPSAIANIYNLVAPHLGTPRIKGPLLDAMNSRVAGASEAAKGVVGLPAGAAGDPRNPVELASNIAGSMIIPGPKLAKATTLPGKAANVALELALPFRQGGLGTVAAATGLGVGITEGADYFGDVPEYNGMADQIKKNFPGHNPNDPFAIASSMEHQMSADPFAMANEYEKKQNKPDQFSAALAAGETPPPNVGMTIPEKLAVGAAALTAVGIGLHTTGVLRNLFTQKMATPGGDLVGIKTNPQITDPLTNIISGTVQSDAGVRKAVYVEAKDAATQAGADKTQAANIAQATATPLAQRMDKLAPGSLNQKTLHAMSTGEMPSSTVDIGPIGPRLDGIASALDQDEMQMLSRGLLAKSALNTRQNASLLAKEDVRPQFSSVDDATLQSYADVVDKDPKLRAAGDIITGAYRNVADYLLDRGRISQSTYDAWIKNNPDYVHMSAAFDDTKDSSFLGVSVPKAGAATRTLDATGARSLVDSGGVQAGAVLDPIVELPKVIRSAIRDAEVNSVKGDVLKTLEGGSIYGVKKVDSPSYNTVSVFHDGEQTHYQVEDKSLRNQVEFNPTVATGTLADIGRRSRMMLTQSVVGRTLNPLFPITSAILDSGSSNLTRQRGINQGIINEVLNKAGLPNVSILDPTKGLWRIPIGSARYLWDSGLQHIADEAAKSMIDDNTMLGKLIPDAASRQAFADKIALYYSESYKALGEREGMFNAHVYAHPDEMKGMGGFEGIMPDFSRYASEQAFLEAKKGNPSFLTNFLQSVGNESVKQNASVFSRLYHTWADSVVHSIKYSDLATNATKITDQASADAITTAIRRTGGDMSQRGGNNFYNSLVEFAPFVNQSVQPLVEIGKMMKTPEGWMRLSTNLGGATLAGLALQYTSAALDPQTAQAIRNDTPQQASGRLHGPAGLKFSVEQSMRPLWGMMVPILNEISGLNAGEFHPDFTNWIKRLSNLSEETQFASQLGLGAGLDAANPFNPGNIPAVSTVMGAAGFDVPATMYNDKPTLVKGDTENTAQNRGTSQLFETTVNNLVAGALATHIKAAVDFANALGHGVDPLQSLHVAASREVDKMASTVGPVEGMMFKNYESVVSPNSAPVQLMYKKKEGVEQIVKELIPDLKYPQMSGANPKVDRKLPTELVDPQYRNTMAFPVGAVTAALQKDSAPFYAKLGELTREDQAIQDRSTKAGVAQYSTTIEQRNQQRNQLLAQRRYISDQILTMTKAAEEKIRQLTGDQTFKYNTMDLSKYKKMPYVNLGITSASQDTADPASEPQ